jgi:hypothetical protein
MKFPAPIQLWILLAITSTALVGLVYITEQQGYRLSADDPQIQLAEDGATAYQNGTTPSQITGPNQVEIASSLAPFVTVFDQSNNYVATSGQFMGQTLSPPSGTFSYAKAHGQERFTWAPRPDSRLAAVLVYTGNSHPGYILAARSLAEVENREDKLLYFSALVLAVMLALSALLVRLLR